MRELIKKHYTRVRRFSFVGLLNTGIDFAVFIVLYQFFDVTPVVAHICAFSIAVVNSFFMNALWTFKGLQRKKMHKQFLKFLMINGIGLLLSTLTIGIAKAYMHPYLAKILAAVVSLAWNYVGSWLFVFKPQGGAER